MTPRHAGLSPGDRVIDRDADDRTHAVVLRELGRADEVRVPIDGQPTVAALNPDYPASADVVEIAFKPALDREVENWQLYDSAVLAGHVEGTPIKTYSYPEPRLDRVEDGGTW